MAGIKQLIALRPVLYLARQYGAGDELPTSDPDMVKAWISAKTAVWKEESTAADAPKAKPVTAEAGMPGKSSTGDLNDLIEKVPKTPERKK